MATYVPRVARRVNSFRSSLPGALSDAGETIASIAQRLGTGTDTVVRVRRLYRQGGVQALYPIKPPGRPPRATPQYIAQMKAAVRTNPRDFGYGFSAP
ncbi:MAG: helix-turn-helix domain-containing protein, partial [Planctomycetes bacterium]|nr:helix-turn-helix domain-containing protein [Planctomycetota bacterium]